MKESLKATKICPLCMELFDAPIVQPNTRYCSDCKDLLPGAVVCMEVASTQPTPQTPAHLQRIDEAGNNINFYFTGREAGVLLLASYLDSLLDEETEFDKRLHFARLPLLDDDYAEVCRGIQMFNDYIAKIWEILQNSDSTFVTTPCSFDECSLALYKVRPLAKGEDADNVVTIEGIEYVRAEETDEDSPWLEIPHVFDGTVWQDRMTTVPVIEEDWNVIARAMAIMADYVDQIGLPTFHVANS